MANKKKYGVIMIEYTLFVLLGGFALLFLLLAFFNKENLDKGITFAILSGILFLVLAMSILAGIQTNQVTSFTDSITGVTVNYQSLTYSDGSGMWVLFWMFIVTGFIELMWALNKVTELNKIVEEEY
jgi:hypothetical protein